MTSKTMATAKSNDRLLKVIKWPMIIAGLWPTTIPTNPFFNKLTALYLLIARIVFGLLISALVIELLRLITQGYPIDVIYSSANIAATGVKALFIVIVCFKNNVMDMFDEIERKEKEIWERYDADIKKVYLKNIKLAKLVGFLISALCIFGGLAVNISNRCFHKVLLY